jgi:hypothetical protein
LCQIIKKNKRSASWRKGKRHEGDEGVRGVKIYEKYFPVEIKLFYIL